ncbi:MAG: M20/M25/M40 family metallo-hydrolase [Candidatus Delongbacteria bacterium]|jgi:acetylornithine deacetylase/succinyl-diaminopimelate desuccinylase-like protein|nr:M20/M25/M40 family metallo-hydrolase [Candidatus Delongbacteria bacterium]
MEVLELLKELIKIDSRNPFELDTINTIDIINKQLSIGGNEIEIAEFIMDKLIEYGFTVEKQFVHSNKSSNKFYNILAEKGTGDHSILFYAHMDTVSANPWLSKNDALTPKMSKLEFQGKERDVLVGLGSNDMKAGIAIMLEAFKDLNPEDHKIKLCFGVDEEFYSLGSNKLVESEFLEDVKAIIVPEIGDGPNYIYGGGSIGIGRLGRCEFEIEVHGTGGHGAISMDESFINAAVEASKIVTALEDHRKTYKDSFEFFHSEVPDTSAINNIQGSYFVNKIDCGDGSLSIPSTGKISIDCTFTPNMTIDKLRTMFENIIEDLYSENILKTVDIDGVTKKCSVKLKDRPTPFSEGYLTGEDHPFTQFVIENVNKTTPFMNYNMGYSVADENVFKRHFPKTPVIVLGPVGWNSHRAHEWVEIQSILDLVKIYGDIGKNFNESLFY